jgi:hypothetical protein
LHDAIGIRQSTEANACVLGVELAQVDASDHCVEYVLAFGDHPERNLNSGLRPSVLVLVAVARRHDQRLDGAADHGWRLT